MSNNPVLKDAPTVVHPIPDQELTDHLAVQLEVIIPALNEARRIGPTIAAVSEYLKGLPFRALITVVDNGSADATADIVKRYNSPELGVRLVGCRHRGKGAAVKAGVMASQATWIGFCDADLATPMSAIAAIVPRLAAGVPVVIGSRRCAGAVYATAQPPVRRLGSWAFRRMTRSLAGGVSDTQCGFKFFERVAGQRIFREVTSAGFSFDLELVAAAVRLGLAVEEVPVEWNDQEGSSLRPLEHGREILREIRSLRKLSAAALRQGESTGAAA